MAHSRWVGAVEGACAALGLLCVLVSASLLAASARPLLLSPDSFGAVAQVMATGLAATPTLVAVAWAFTRIVAPPPSLPLPPLLRSLTPSLSLPCLLVLTLLLGEFCSELWSGTPVNASLYAFEGREAEVTAAVVAGDVVVAAALVRWDAAFQLLVTTPLLEELTYRGLALYALCKRSKRFGIPEVAIAAAMFAAVHAINFFGDRFTPAYVILQMAVAATVGAFYVVHLAYSGSLFQCVLLHACNNFLSSLLVDATAASAVLSPLMAAKLGWTVVAYGGLACWEWAQLQGGREKLA